MTTRIDAGMVTADHGLESKHRALWALGDYTTVATELVSPLGPVLVEASGIGAGDRVLDVAAGAGNAAIPAALAGANVIASDLVPELLHELRAHDPLGEAREVLDVGRLLEEAAPGEALDHQRLQVGARGVERGRIAGGAATDDDHVLDWLFHNFIKYSLGWPRFASG